MYHIVIPSPFTNTICRGVRIILPSLGFHENLRMTTQRPREPNKTEIRRFILLICKNSQTFLIFVYGLSHNLVRECGRGRLFIPIQAL